jgi:DNA/RNA-binding domain of Phe-tRNA-synthetase-like protein
MAKDVRVEDAVFAIAPTFVRSVIIAEDVNIHAADKQLEDLLSFQQSARAKTDLSTSTELRAWDDTHRAFGSNPNKYPPSIKSLLKRTVAGGVLPYVNTIVALFNYISLKYLMPCGGDDLDRTEGSLILGIASGDESFAPLGTPDKPEKPDQGEVIYYDSANHNIMCRRWNWRNSDVTKITTETKRVAINIDCLLSAHATGPGGATDELAKLIVDHCGAKIRQFVIAPNTTTHDF